MIEMLSMPFMLRALAGCLVVGFLTGYFGVFIVQRKMSFLGSGLGHAAFGGVALGLLLETEPLWVGLPFTIIVALGITYLKENTKLAADTVIGILFAVSIALGIIFISLKDSYSVDAFAYLFGSILFINPYDLYVSGALLILTIAISMKYWPRWAYATFDRELARSDRINVAQDDYLLSALIAVAIVVSVKIAGIVLVSAFLVIPAAAARLTTCTFFRMTIYSAIIGILSSIIGLYVSYELDMPSGAIIILIQAMVFFSAFVMKFLRR